LPKYAPLEIVADMYVSIVLTDADGNVLSEQFTEDTDEEDNAENIIFNNQQPPSEEIEAIEKEAGSNAGSTTNADNVTPPEGDDMEHMRNAEDKDNTQEEAVEHKERESMSKESL